MPEGEWVLTDHKINVALGAEIQRARKAAGLTRPELVARLPFEITVAALLNWELGHRGISYLRLIEVARTLGYTAPQLLERAIERVEAIQTEYVLIDVIAMRDDTTAPYQLLRNWATRKCATLDKDVRVVHLHHTVIKEWALMLNTSLMDLVLQLEKVASLTPRATPGDSRETSD